MPLHRRIACPRSTCCASRREQRLAQTENGAVQLQGFVHRERECQLYRLGRAYRNLHVRTELANHREFGRLVYGAHRIFRQSCGLATGLDDPHAGADAAQRGYLGDLDQRDRRSADPDGRGPVEFLARHLHFAFDRSRSRSTDRRVRGTRTSIASTTTGGCRFTRSFRAPTPSLVTAKICNFTVRRWRTTLCERGRRNRFRLQH